MASKLLIAFFLGAISMTVVSAQNFDFFYFVQQWPGSYCDTDSGCCFPLAGSPGAQFGIHGLWPNYNDGGYPSKCGGDAFNPNVLSDVLADMNREWGSLACPSSDSESFWDHEWTTHGTCSGFSQHAYFKAALNLYNQYDLTGGLAAAGINPDGSQYNVEDIRNALQSVLGQLPGIQCNKDQSGNRQLYQVYVCVATDGQTVIQCPVFPNNECKGSVEFPVYQSNSAASSDANVLRSEL